MPSHKTCTRCGQTKPIEDFHRRRKGSEVRETRCKPCSKEHSRERYAVTGRRKQSPEYFREWKKKHGGKVPDGVPHGLSTYKNYECRCEICTQANAEYEAKRKKTPQPEAGGGSRS